MDFSRSFIRFNWLTLVFIYLIVIAGSFVRITGSGMGCPDWPRCFGQWVPPTSEASLPENYREMYGEKRAKKIEKFARFLSKIGLSETGEKILKDPTLRLEEKFNAQKTWTEYVNRLFGFLAGNAMLICFFWILLRYRRRKIILLTLTNLILMGFEGWFGSIVVASNLVPWTITVHLFIALVIIAIQIKVIYEISPKQQVKLQFGKTMYWIIVLVFGITFYQLFLGTQVREYIDELTKAGFGRETWTEKLGLPFYIHRTFSWLVLALLTFITWKNEKGRKYWTIRVLYLILGIELLSGVLLAYANMPGLVQTSHLVFACVLFGILTMLILRMQREEKTYKKIESQVEN